MHLQTLQFDGHHFKYETTVILEPSKTYNSVAIFLIMRLYELRIGATQISLNSLRSGIWVDCLSWSRENI